ncbi:dihydrolipoyllysine-residue acetyltransferase [Marinobacterium sediminicola]|uniref:Acetyltransferase component of pyruvate dehydrogenase complex n=1 Tax=Marinobacterium sediminicola TaxID=518898 RepID=A0ABY1RZZ0_9GAMM|nr:dihydrolipoyllysine-residue acetyltransferase [Marinobacterium sediminicola]ULG70044.1 dihydrolipoyllysine-residue acetyltransferase [Marinobacterium sediminicola]SMR74499.1 pyruvate dehydrogenase E2 component (dihydrolipoamide acetyltransferase) [Marinobacterium sediminicola]
MTTTTITVPDIGGSENVDIVEVCVSVGDTIAEGDSLIVLETDKASMEVPSTHAGVVKNIIVSEGGTCNEGDAILELEVDGAGEVEQPAPAAAAAVKASESPIDSVAAPAATTSTRIEQVLVPDLSGAADVDVIEVLVKAGDEIAEGDSLITLETDKASMEVPAPKGGKVVSVKIKEGDQVNEGDLLLELEISEGGAAGADSASAAEQSSAPAAEPAPASVAAPVPVQAGGVEPVTVPDLSGASDVDVIEVLVKVGDEIAEGDSLITLETDKASMEVPAPKGGKVVSVKIKEGDQVNEGDLILELEVAGAPAAAPVAEAPKAAPAQAPAAASPSAPSKAPAVDKNVDLAVLEKKNRNVHAGPAVRALAREFGVELENVSGSGRKGRILKEDVQTYVKSALKQLAEKGPAAVTGGSGIPAIPAVDFSKFGETEMVKLSKVDKITRDNMSRCWLNIPHVTQFDEADITELEAFRKEMKDVAAKEGVKLTPLPFMIKAAAIALKRHQKFNASLHHDGEHIVYKKYVNIGIAVDTPNGLMVPVIKDADKKSVYELSREATELAGKAKDRKLKPNEMQGACFTISSLGGIGGTGFTPIVNAPEVAILGVSKADIKPRWNGKEFEPRMMLPLCLSYDHRAINGGDAGRFLTELNGLLSDIRRLLL